MPPRQLDPIVDVHLEGALHVTVRAHQECPVAGEARAAGAGQVARFFVGRTRGEHNPAPTAKDVRDHLDLIRNESDSFIPADPGVAMAHPLRGSTPHP